MKSKSIIVLTVLVFLMATDASATTVFSDDFENDTTGSFPTKWTIFNKYPDQINSVTTVVDEATAPGWIYEGNKSTRITFNGGSGSGIQTTFEPITQGVLTFYCNIDWATDDLQLMGLHNLSDTQSPGSHLITVSACLNNSVWEYSVGGAFTGIPVVFDEYVKFDMYFDTKLSAATLYINDEITNFVDFPFENPSSGVTTLRSCDDSGPGTAQWYLDNVTVTPEPSTFLLIGFGAVLLRKKRLLRTIKESPVQN